MKRTAKRSWQRRVTLKRSKTNWWISEQQSALGSAELENTCRRNITGGPHDRRRGITLIEVAVSTILVGTIMIASLRTVGAVARYRGETTDEQRGTLLADELMSRILQYGYNDPDQSPTLGREYWERIFDLPFDDIDDFDGYSESPPTDGSGSPLTGFDNWSWSVAVDYVDPTTLSVIAIDQGAKRLRVRVSKAQEIVAESTIVTVDLNEMDPGS